MSDELVDIVDADNTVIGSAFKKEAHEKGLLHRCVVAEIRDSQGRWLLVKQASDRQDAGQYVSPVGGHVQAGESEDDALRREADEEVGLQGDFEFSFVGRIIFDRHIIGRHENHFFALYEISSDVQPHLNEESESYKYFTEDEIRTALRERPQILGHAFHFVLKAFYPQLLA
ncbi:MAG TPA: NUDIX domain-containing protein [Candidatus Paceibacterota bacterium]|nr:NUDIX domain-containing protein [Candidatus Paceibacterota bacterium]